MKNFVVFALILIGLNCSCSNSFAYGSLKVQKDYRYTTQRDRNARIKAYQEYLERNKVFDVDHRSNKENFEKYKDDPNHRDNIKFLKFGTELKDKNYKVIGNYYLMADNILANYSVIYDDDYTTEYIYDMFGNLYQVKVLVGEEYIRPHYKITYSNNGHLQKVSFFANDGYEYIFLANNNFQGVVVNGKLYNRVGRPVEVWLL